MLESSLISRLAPSVCSDVGSFCTVGPEPAAGSSLEQLQKLQSEMSDIKDRISHPADAEAVMSLTKQIVQVTA